MAKTTSQFICQNCGVIRPKWAGRCDNCGEWNTLTEQLADTNKTVASGRALDVQNVARIKQTKTADRVATRLPEVDLVLGGGFVPGSVNLIAGEPGIGKSTLLMQVAHAVATKQKVLYVSAEESAQQLRLRADRLGAKAAKLDIATSTSTNDIAHTIAAGSYALVVVDSIQTIAVSEISSAAGNVSQITNSAQLLTQTAKQAHTALVLVGHVTKEGAIAGPKVLEHLVDVVLNLEGDRYGGFKILRSVKNRYGSTNEAGIFEMTEQGLTSIKNPSQALLEERHVSDGSVVLATMEGSRPLLVEVQALVQTTSFGYPKRTASGIDHNRLNLLIAMLSRRTKLNLGDKDVYVNVIGGMKITEPAADLAVCMAIGSAAKGLQLKTDAVVFGEVGLSGEVRHVPNVDKRLAEAKKLGFKLAIGPKSKKKLSGLHSVGIVREALNAFLVKG